MKTPKLSLLPLALAATFCAGAAHAQSSVTVYGLIDAGLTWTNDRASYKGNSSTTVDTGVAQGSRLGFKGSEDLGDGLRANFVLEQGMNVDTGSLAQGGLAWGRQASVGLAGGFGEVSLGRVFDVMGEVFPAYAIGSNTPAGSMAWSLPMYSAGGATLVNRVYGAAINNSVRYRSPKLGGFSAMATYSLGEQENAPIVKGSTFSGAVTYTGGNFGASVGTYQQRNASVANGDIAEYALGAYLQASPDIRLFSMASQVAYSAGTKARATTYELGMNYNLKPNLVLGTGLQAQKRRKLSGAEQLTLTLDYLLSKRTDVYATIASGRDREFGALVVAALGSVSSGTSQTGLRVGIRHKF
jgi:predicted porin